MKKIIKSTAIIFAAIAIGFGFSSCNSVKPVDKTKLAGYWVLKTMEGKPATASFEGSLPSLEFNLSENRISGSGGCNRYMGGFALNETNEFTATQAATTMMMCMDKNAEPEFLKLMATPNLVLSFDKDGLLTFTQGEKVILAFEKGTEPLAGGAQIVSTKSLAGAWALKSLVGEDMAKLYTEKMPTIVFTEDGKVSGNGSCNTYRSSYTLNEGLITFTPAMSTKMACPSLAGESKFMIQLETPLVASINGETLTLSRAGNIVMELTKTVAE